LGCQKEQLCDPAGRAFIDLDDTNYENNGADAARIVMRGNTLVNNSCAVPVQDQNVTIANYYSSVLADSTNNFATTIATNSDGTRLLVTVPPPNTNNYSTVIVDFYAVDPVALSKNFVQGKSYLGSVVDGSELDLDPAPNRVAFHIGNLNLSGVATVAVMVTYSQDAGPATQAGRAVAAIYSNSLTVAPVAAPLSIG